MKSVLIFVCAALAFFVAGVVSVPSYCDHNHPSFQARHPFYIDDYSNTKFFVRQGNYKVHHERAYTNDFSTRANVLELTGTFDFYQDNIPVNCGWLSTLVFSIPGYVFSDPGNTWLFLVDYYIRVKGPNAPDNVPQNGNPEYEFIQLTGNFDFIGLNGQGDKEFGVGATEFAVNNQFITPDNVLTKVTNPYNPGGIGTPLRFYISGDVKQVPYYNNQRQITDLLFLLGDQVTQYDRPEIQPIMDTWRNGTFQCAVKNVWGFGTKCYNLAVIPDPPSMSRSVEDQPNSNIQFPIKLAF